MCNKKFCAKTVNHWFRLEFFEHIQVVKKYQKKTLSRQRSFALDPATFEKAAKAFNTGLLCALDCSAHAPKVFTSLCKKPTAKGHPPCCGLFTQRQQRSARYQSHFPLLADTTCIIPSPGEKLTVRP